MSGAASPAPQSSFVHRGLDVIFKIARLDPVDKSGQTITGYDLTTVQGLRVKASIEMAALGESMGTAQIRVYGLDLSTMNKLSTIGLFELRNYPNRVNILAGEARSTQKTLVFDGAIGDAFADFNGMPEVALAVAAFCNLAEKRDSNPPSSYRGAVDVAQILAGLATQMGMMFRNNGVSVILSNPYLSGSWYEQAKDAAHAANIEITMDNNTMVIWPKGGSRGGVVPLISPDTGLVGYPSYAANGVMLRTLFNPALGNYGQKIIVKSSVTPACGTWIIQRVIHDLESETPNGQWFSSIYAMREGSIPQNDE